MEKRKRDPGREESVQQNSGKEAGDSESSKDAEDQRQEKRIDGRNPGGGPGVLAKEIAETFSLRESQGDVAGFLFEGNGGEDLMGNFALLVPDEGDASAESGGGDEPDGG